MAPLTPSPEPPEYRTIVLEFEPSEDRELTCVVCGQTNVDLECTVRNRSNSRVTLGKHTHCVWKKIR